MRNFSFFHRSLDSFHVINILLESDFRLSAFRAVFVPFASLSVCMSVSQRVSHVHEFIMQSTRAQLIKPNEHTINTRIRQMSEYSTTHTYILPHSHIQMNKF